MTDIQISHSGEVKKGAVVVGCITGFRFLKTGMISVSGLASNVRDSISTSLEGLTEDPAIAMRNMPSEEAFASGNNQEENEAAQQCVDTETGLLEQNDLDLDLSLLEPLLAKEYEKRAEQLAASEDKDFCLRTDGHIYWLGAPVAQLIAQDDLLKPSFVILSDKVLSASNKEQIFSRIEKFLHAHLEKFLKPLYALKEADYLAESTKYIAQRLYNSLGFLPRAKVLQEVRALDQESRAALRLLGTRFGTCYLYLPALLKPQAIEILFCLWAVKNAGFSMKGYKELPENMLSGRTSIVVDPTFHKRLYSLAGYKIVGPRAVRIDILERLVNLIRTLTQWEPQAGPHINGAYGEKKFYITLEMLSILGTNLDDMVQILQALGYNFVQIKEGDLRAHLENYQKTSVENVSPAEPVGDIAAAYTNQPYVDAAVTDDQMHPSEGDEKDSNLFVVQGAKKGGNDSAEISEEKLVLLWHYQGQPRMQPSKEIMKRSRKGKPFFSKKDQSSSSSSENTQSFEKRSKRKPTLKKNKDGKVSSYMGERKSFTAKAQRTADTDSPFAALAQLKDLLKK